jgi:predicted acyltransferase
MDASPASDIPPQPPRQRIASVDAFRGLVMFLLMAEVLRIARVAANYPGNAVWETLKFHMSHVDWTGCSLHDLIQPSFSFLVGVALPFSIAARAVRGQSRGMMTLHACWRAVVLVLLGVFLRSVGTPETNWTFEDTLSQIGLGYPILFALGLMSQPTPAHGAALESSAETDGGRNGAQPWKATLPLVALAVILFGYWLAWALWPVAPADYDFAAVGVPPDWTHHATGFAAHWNKNANLGSAFDQWFLNLFPRGNPFVANKGGYLTLSFIPTLATMILGLIAGRWLVQWQRDRACQSPATRAEMPGGGLPAKRDAMWVLARLGAASFLCFMFSIALDALGLCPIVKRIWTPGWVLFSGGWCFALLAAFYLVMDAGGLRRWAFPLTVIGMNSIAAYVIAHLFHGFINESLKTHLGAGFFEFAGKPLAPLIQGAAVLLIYWLILFWMYRRKIFLKV